MAGAEARAVWQRTVNRCFVQEDAKRAPKLTYCHQSSTTKQQVQVEEEEQQGSRLVLDHPKNQSGFLMPLHRNPNFTDTTRLWSHHHHHHHHHIVENKPLVDAEEQDKSFKTEFIGLMETKESYGFDDDDCCSYEKKLTELAFDPCSPWNPLSSEKAGPWWRTTDKDELASLVAQRRSLDYVENCDLPTPQKMNRSYHGSLSNNQTVGTSRGSKNRTEVFSSSESGLTKSELLEALRRSQTRAREAENMAKEAYAEKEHLVKLLFKQASELFGYKQWLKLLQLEALYFQIKNKKEEPEVSSIPWSNPKGRKPVRKRRSKRVNNKPNGAKYAVGLAFGMSLVGAGLLLGWTVGWMQMLSF